MDETIRPILRRSHLVGLRLADGEAVETVWSETRAACRMLWVAIRIVYSVQLLLNSD